MELSISAFNYSDLWTGRKTLDKLQYMDYIVIGNNFSGYDAQIEREIASRGHRCVRLMYPYPVPSDKRFNNRLGAYLFYLLILGLTFGKRLRFTLELRKVCRQYPAARIIMTNGSFVVPWLLPRVSSRRSAIWLMDPLERFPLSRHTFRRFSHRFTYDPRDLTSLSASLLPLFADTSIYDAALYPVGNDYLFAFVGAVYENRAVLLERLCEIAETMGLEVYFGGIFGKVTVARLQFTLGKFPKLQARFQNRQHSHQEIAAIYSRAQVIINFNAENHLGYSMRTFEALALGRQQICDVYRPGEFPANECPEAFIPVTKIEEINPDMLTPYLNRTFASRNVHYVASLRHRIDTIIGSLESAVD